METKRYHPFAYTQSKIIYNNAVHPEIRAQPHNRVKINLLLLKLIIIIIILIIKIKCQTLDDARPLLVGEPLQRNHSMPSSMGAWPDGNKT